MELAEFGFCALNVRGLAWRILLCKRHRVMNSRAAAGYLCFINAPRHACRLVISRRSLRLHAQPPCRNARIRLTMVQDQERPVWGNLRRTTPFSDHYAFDRGTPIDRYYVAQFM